MNEHEHTIRSTQVKPAKIICIQSLANTLMGSVNCFDHPCYNQDEYIAAGSSGPGNKSGA